MEDVGRAEFHQRREAEELKRAETSSNPRARQLHLELANQHRIHGLACLLASDPPIAA